MTAELDLNQYLPMFLAEYDENIEEIETALVALEREGGNRELLNRVFRGAHTIKGAAATMGFEQVASLTHDLENVLDQLRQGGLALTPGLTDLLFRSLDALKELRAGASPSSPGGAIGQGLDLAGLRRELAAVGADGGGVSAGQLAPVPPYPDRNNAGGAGNGARSSPVELDDVELNVLRAAEIKGYHAYFLKVTLDAGCQMQGPRAYLVFHNLRDYGEVIKTVPPAEDIEAGRFGDTFSFVLLSLEDADTIVSIIKSISEIAAVELALISSEGGQPGERLAGQPGPPLGGEQATGVSRGSPAGSGGAASPKPSQTVRVEVQRLENLMNLVGELVLDRTRLTDVALRFRQREVSGQGWELLDEVSGHIGRVTGELQEEIMKARMFPIEQVFNRFPRLVRDLSQKAGKEIDLVLEGRETELDRTVIEEIGDPLIHLLRNAVDHGIEPPEDRRRAGKPGRGTVRLAARQRENQIVITVEDDGRGMDAAALRRKAVARGMLDAAAANRLSDREALGLIFLPGFSTAEQVSDVSGRGVGMDIVRTNIERINGTLDMQTSPGRGSTFTIRLPLTLAINRSLLVTAAGSTLAIPLANVVEILSLPPDLQTVRGQEVTLHRGQTLTVVSLAEILDLAGPDSPAGDDAGRRAGLAAGLLAAAAPPGSGPSPGPANLNVVVVSLDEIRIGLVVDSLIGEQEIVIKSLGQYINRVPGIAGATILGDGRVALILDVRGLFQRSQVARAVQEGGSRELAG